MKMKKCIHCGKEIEDNAKFCMFCGKGQTLDNSDNVIETNQNNNSLEKVNDKRWTPATVTAMLVVAFILLAVGIASHFLRYILSEEHIEQAIQDTDISSINVGSFIVGMNDIMGEYATSEDAEDFDYFVSQLDGDETLGEFLFWFFYPYTEEIDILYDGTLKEKDFEEAINSKEFKKEITEIITSYTNNLFFAKGKGKVYGEEIGELMYIIYKNSIYEEYDDIWNVYKNNAYNYYFYYDFYGYDDYGNEIYTEEELKEKFENDINNYLLELKWYFQNTPDRIDYYDDMFDYMSVKNLADNPSIRVIRILCSKFFEISVFCISGILIVMSLINNKEQFGKMVRKMLVFALADAVIMLAVFIYAKMMVNGSLFDAGVRWVTKIYVFAMKKFM